ncbi:MAG: transketolase, partial [Pseudonocardiaceae bacterium]
MTMTEPHPTGLLGRYRYADLRELMTRMTGDEKHAPSATSTLDVLWVLYDRVLRLTPSTMDDPDRDRFLLSKG